MKDASPVGVHTKSLAAAAAMLMVMGLPVSADHPDGGDEFIVAVLDSGIRATHDEFDYDPNVAGPNGQLVAWWDFGTDDEPNGDTWHTGVAPYDDNGHGTGTASMVGGATVGAFPGANLAIAKVTNSAGSIAHLREAYEWAVYDVKADIISISIGTIIPFPGLLDSLDEQISRARAHGIMTVVAAGNGGGPVGCVPAHTWMYGYGYSRDALAVGNLAEEGAMPILVSCRHMDPDVTSNGNFVTMASHEGDDEYVQQSGTSFAAPWIAGAAAELMVTAEAAGKPYDPDTIEDIILDCSSWTAWTYAFQGHGFYHTAEHAVGLGHAASGTTCPAPTTFFAGTDRSVANLYRDNVQQNGKAAFSEVADIDRLWGHNLRGTGAATPSGVIGQSVPVGESEVELYHVDLVAGDTLNATFAYAVASTDDFDVGLFHPGAEDDGVLALTERLESAGQAAGLDETLTWTADLSGTYTIAVYGWQVDQAVAYTVTSTHALNFVADDLAISQTLIS